MKFLYLFVFVFDQNRQLPHVRHTHTQQEDSEGSVRCNSLDLEPQSNSVECVLVLPETETYTRGTTGVHSQRSCTVTPNQTQVQAGWNAGGSRRSRCPRPRQSSPCCEHVADSEKGLFEGLRQTGLAFCHYCDERQVQEKVQDQERVHGKEAEQLWPRLQMTPHQFAFDGIP